MLLTIKSNFTIFKERQGQEYKAEELESIFKALIKEDIINFKGNISYGYTRPIANKILTKLNTRQINKDSIIVIINDLTLQMLYTLLEDGYQRENIYLAYGKWDYNNNKARPSVNKISYNIMKETIKHNIEETINVITLEELFDMGIKIDAIIANPPYGAIGANITDYIRQNIDYDLYVNLLPVNDYKRNKTKDLFNYQSDMEVISNGFEDAAVTTHVCRVHKNRANDMTLTEFERSQYIDKSLDKYFEENSKRSMTTEFDTSILSATKTYDNTKTFIIGWRDPVNKHMPYSKDCSTYKWNVEESIDFMYVIANHLNKANNSVPFGGLVFKTSIEKQNYSKFVYSYNGFRFMSKLFTAVQSDMLKTMSTYFIKVDWSRSWTVEQILEDYGYTTDEIKEVITDLETNPKYKCLKD